MKDIIPPVEKNKLVEELTKDKFIRNTNFGNNEIYEITAHNSPNVMKEIGRLREYTFREAGGGTGKEIDIDAYDTQEDPYIQLLVWNPVEKEILGAYRYFSCKPCKSANHLEKLATAELFHFSQEFVDQYMPYMIELGRSFVQPKYQSTHSRNLLFTLDNLWDGLGALVVDHPETKYFFGKVTMYQNYNKEARDYIIYFLKTYFGDQDHLVYPKQPIELITPEEDLKKVFHGNDYKADYKILSQRIRKLGQTIPPLINSYMNLSPTMKMFGTALNEHFGNVEETGIMITIKDLYKTKSDRHIESYKNQK